MSLRRTPKTSPASSAISPPENAAEAPGMCSLSREEQAAAKIAVDAADLVGLPDLNEKHHASLLKNNAISGGLARQISAYAAVKQATEC